MKKHPIIITAPHSCKYIPKEIRERISLSNFEIWQMHDPFTDETCFYPRAYAIHKAKSHRILGDLSRDRDAKDIFRRNDFYGRKIWKDKKGLTNKEKEAALKQYWDPFRSAIKKSFEKMKKEGFKKILFIDHHNTATDHPANYGQYLPPLNLGNYGDDTGSFTQKPLSSSPEIISAFQVFLKEEFPGITVEINTVYEGSALVRFIRDEIQPEFPNCEIHAIHLEYNVNLIFNSLSNRIDDAAKNKLHKGINRGIYKLIKNHFL
ncbi:MAG: N-formylglutamate amidohydrolase [Patescibacteria group bacterium]|nr:N-formylglutamate amidohydrolase [Patescibacteria group bacterium]